MNTNVTFIGELRKGHILYLFEISESHEEDFSGECDFRIVESAYIEKRNLTTNSEGECGHFSIDQARKCWKALKAKGYREFDSFEDKYLEKASK